ncbi:MAG: hypothetical protein J6K92_00990 [Oscillospiraceae bacterium]|nr:hypothetical protein [Oscillospiraceae bacterium]
MSRPHTEKILAESRNYTVISEFESVYLKKIDGTKILIGDFYGDPIGALIDRDERFVIMYGCGLIMYYLRPPFEEYSYSSETDQWYEFGRDEPVRWIENVVQLDKNSFQLTGESGENDIITI